MATKPKLNGFDSMRLNSLAISVSTVLQNRPPADHRWRVRRWGHQWLLIVGSDRRLLQRLGRMLAMESMSPLQSGLPLLQLLQASHLDPREARPLRPRSISNPQPERPRQEPPRLLRPGRLLEHPLQHHQP